MLRGDFGISYTQQNRRVNDIIREHFPVSATLGILAIVVRDLRRRALGRADRALPQPAARRRHHVPRHRRHLGAELRRRRRESARRSSTRTRAFGRSLLPVAGWGTVWHMLVPALVLGLEHDGVPHAAHALVDARDRDSDFVRTARAKGLPPTRIFLKHQLRNAILPVVTVLGPQIALITTGGFVVELVFAIPGPRPLLRRGRAAARLHGDHGHDGVLRRVPGASWSSSSTSSTASSIRA